MANKVSIVFEGDAKQLFATADQVERRLKQLTGMTSLPAARIGGPVPNPAANLGALPPANAALLTKNVSALDSNTRALHDVARALRQDAAGDIGGRRAVAAGGPVGAAGGFGAGLATGALQAAIPIVITAATVTAIKRYGEELAETEQRSNRLKTASDQLGVSQKELAANVDAAARTLRLTKQEAEAIITPLGELAGVTRQSLTELKNAVIDVASDRGIDKDSLPSLLRSIAEGSADAAIFGRNAASIFDLYASSIGKTAGELTDVERKQALVNELLKQGALNAGDAASAMAKQATSVDQLKKSADALLRSLGELGSTVAKPVIDFVVRGLGGEPDFGRFDPSRAFQDIFSQNFSPSSWIENGGFLDTNPLRIYAEDLEAVDRENKAKFKKIIDSFNADKKLIEDAIANPTRDISNRALAGIDLTAFLKLSPEQRQQAKQDAIANAKELQEITVRAFETGIDVNAGDVNALRQLSSNIAKTVFDPEEIKRLSAEASKAIADGYKQMIERAGDNVGSLRNLRSQIMGTGELGRNERLALFDDIDKQISDSIDKAKDKVKSLGDAFRGAFDTVVGRSSQSNPFLQFLNDADRRMSDLRENTKGFSSELRGALAGIEQANNRRDLAGLRIDAALQANDLQTQAREFRQGFRNDLSNPQTLQQIVDQQIRAIGGRSAGDPIAGPTGKPIVSQFYDLNDPRLSGRPFDGTNFAFPPLDDPRARPLDETQRAVQDQKLIDLAGRIDPAKLREDQRAAFSDALEREANRRLTAEADAQKERQKQSGIQAEFLKEMKALNALARAGGLNAIVRFVDKSNRADISTSPTQQQTNDLYNPR